MAQTIMRRVGNTRVAQLTADIDASAQTIPVTDAAFFPAAPNYATLGTENDAEVVLYNGINTTNNTLTNCLRGQSGTIANSWPEGADVYHAWTSATANTIMDNVADHETRVQGTEQAIQDIADTVEQISTDLTALESAAVTSVNGISGPVVTLDADDITYDGDIPVDTIGSAVDAAYAAAEEAMNAAAAADNKAVMADGKAVAADNKAVAAQSAADAAQSTATAALSRTDADIPYTGVVIPDATTMQEAVELAYNHGSGGKLRINTIRITSGKGHVVIPPGVGSISATLVSGGQGATAGSPSSTAVGGVGGLGGGAVTVLNIPVEEGQSYYYEIGKGGKNGVYNSPPQTRYGGDTVFGQYRATGESSTGQPVALLDDVNLGLVAGNGENGSDVMSTATTPFIQPIAGGGPGGTKARVTNEVPRAGFNGENGTGAGGAGGGARYSAEPGNGGDGGSGLLFIQFIQSDVEPDVVHVLETFSESGFYTVPEDCSEVDLFIASGADGGTDGAVGIEGEPGLGGAFTVVRNYRVTPGSVIEVTVGNGGTRGANGSPRATRIGGVSSFGNIHVNPEIGSIAPIHAFRDSNYHLLCGMGGVANAGGNIMPEGGGGVGATTIDSTTIAQQGGKDGLPNTAGGGGAGCKSPTGSSSISRAGNGGSGVVIVRRATRVSGSGGNLAGLTVDIPNYINIDNITVRAGSIDTTRRMAVEE